MDGTNHIKIYDDVIEDYLLHNILEVINVMGFNYGWKSNKGLSYSHWNLPFSTGGKPSSNRDDVREELPNVVRELWDRIQPVILEETPVLIRAYCNAYTYGTDGYAHTDSKFENDVTAIIYLNQSWNIDWAGETVFFEDGEIIKSVIPKWNRAIIFPSNMKHAGRGVSRFCTDVRKVLVFKACPVLNLV
jgi:SM-20-related protein